MQICSQDGLWCIQKFATAPDRATEGVVAYQRRLICHSETSLSPSFWLTGSTGLALKLTSLERALLCLCIVIAGSRPSYFVPTTHLERSTSSILLKSTMTLISPETATPWVPNMVFRARRNKDTPKTLCERFVEEQVVTFIRAYFPMGGPNFDYGPVMERATRFVMYIVST